MNRLYPLKFKPLFKEKIWGGEKILTNLGLDYSPLKNCGEAWVLSGVEGSGTKVSNGFLKGNDLNELVEVFMDDLVGEKAFDKFKNEFPVLVKFIDSRQYLSIQVHPNDELAARRKIGNGKSEMWYILDASPDAEIIDGFNRDIDQKIFLDHLNRNTLPEIMNVEKVSQGDVFFIPAGRIHALGPGVLLAEIQQTSDTTYRIFDWNRVDSNGKPRELHTELALEAIDYSRPDHCHTHYQRNLNKTVPLVDDIHFICNLLEFDRPIRKDYMELDSFVILLCINGAMKVSSENGQENVKCGETILLPAITEKVSLFPDPGCKILEIYMI
ncbi:MAG: class I mannose-6-phosphate isomerase [Bacteroidota bacterium]|nr:class I mannose-6-phosphate isomerase [Bacteroidota bacterium]